MFFGDWVSDSVGFYMDFMSKEEMRDAGEREREKQRKRENTFLMREEREV